MSPDAADRARRVPAIPGQELATWVPVLGLSLLVFNDAVIKNHWPGVISGKLSDFAVVLYFPFLLTASWSLASAALRALGRKVVRRSFSPAPGLTRPRLLAGMALTTFALSAVNVSTRARDLYLELLDAIDVLGLMPGFGYTVDPTDLVGLLCLPVVWWWGNRLIRAGAVTECDTPEIAQPA
jgi:hypothetical protein